MSIRSLSIENVRKISNAFLEPSSRLNLIVGSNAAGKTSILESIDCLSRGRSFRVKSGRTLISHGQEKLRIYGRIIHCDHNVIDLGIEKSTTKTNISVHGQKAKKVSELAARLPVQIMHAEGRNLIGGSSNDRRSYMDWGVFHVEHTFFQNWIRYRHILKQRNAALKNQSPAEMICGWDSELSQTAKLVDDARYRYISALKPHIAKWVDKLLVESSVELNYSRGWPADLHFFDYLHSHLKEDYRVAYTHAGPHNADIKIYLQGKPADQVASKGQQKLIVAALKLAQIDLFINQTGKSCIVLIDDFSSELDEVNRGRFIHSLKDMKVQIYITAFERHLVDVDKWDHSKVFHVEHGEVRELLY
jgi:DNA replication and repair protein RecF